ncbi:MAG: hypothetical protein OEZ19_00150 [Paracoccaceae bacterium]|nr:hypothetical protein [Paracoccaceae bacterium]
MRLLAVNLFGAVAAAVAAQRLEPMAAYHCMAETAVLLEQPERRALNPAAEAEVEHLHLVQAVTVRSS